MKTNGRLVILDAANEQIWIAKTNVADSQASGSRLVVQNDGNAVMYNRNNRSIWSTDTAVRPPGANKNVLKPNEFLLPGQKLVSTNGRYQLIYQNDGNLVLQDDGNLVIYHPGNFPLWSTNTQGGAVNR